MKSQPAKKAQRDKHESQKASNNPMLGKWNVMNRKQRRELARQIYSNNMTLQIIHAHAAGIDVGKETHYVAVPPIGMPSQYSSLVLCQLHGRLAADGDLAEEVWDHQRGAAVYRGLLDRVVRHFAGGRLRGVPGECPVHQEPTRAEE